MYVENKKATIIQEEEDGKPVYRVILEDNNKVMLTYTTHIKTIADTTKENWEAGVMKYLTEEEKNRIMYGG
jgi:heat shock protein HspQ